jgi:hypothetical protein
MGNTVPLREYFQALRRADRRLARERDRRIRDIRAGDLRALAVAAEAAERAEDLRAENQAYRDEKANNLREQIGSERGLYVTRTEFQPILDYVVTQQGINTARRLGIGQILALIGTFTAVVSAVAVIIALIVH